MRTTYTYQPKQTKQGGKPSGTGMLYTKSKDLTNL